MMTHFSDLFIFLESFPEACNVKNLHIWINLEVAVTKAEQDSPDNHWAFPDSCDGKFKTVSYMHNNTLAQSCMELTDSALAQPS